MIEAFFVNNEIRNMLEATWDAQRSIRRAEYMKMCGMEEEPKERSRWLCFYCNRSTTREQCPGCGNRGLEAKPPEPLVISNPSFDLPLWTAPPDDTRSHEWDALSYTLRGGRKLWIAGNHVHPNITP